jgi:hypothetical protein
VNVGAKFKLDFFDSKLVTTRVDASKRRLLSRVGAFTRRRVKGSLRYGTGHSLPGQPPTVHRSIGFTKKSKSKGVEKQQPASPLRELQFFAYDEARDSVVIGPAIGGSRSGAPEVLEWGGTSKVVRRGRTVTITIGARPSVQPALATEGPKAIESLTGDL